MPTPKAGYWLNGKRVPSVSTILGNLGWGNERLMAWSADLGLQGIDYRVERQTACDIGTCAYDMIDCHLHGRLLEIGKFPEDIIDQALTPYAAFRAWLVDNALEVVATEFPLVSSALRYGGTPDALVRMHREPVLIDFKTSKWLFPKHVIQVVAYMDLIAECRGYRLDRAVILRVGKDGQFKTLTVDGEAITQARTAFYHLLELHKLQKPLDALTRSVNTPGEPRPPASVMTLMGIPLDQAVLA